MQQRFFILLLIIIIIIIFSNIMLIKAAEITMKTIDAKDTNTVQSPAQPSQHKHRKHKHHHHHHHHKNKTNKKEPKTNFGRIKKTKIAITGNRLNANRIFHYMKLVTIFILTILITKPWIEKLLAKPAADNGNLTNLPNANEDNDRITHDSQSNTEIFEGISIDVTLIIIMCLVALMLVALIVKIIRCRRNGGKTNNERRKTIKRKMKMKKNYSKKRIFNKKYEEDEWFDSPPKYSDNIEGEGNEKGEKNYNNDEKRMKRIIEKKVMENVWKRPKSAPLPALPPRERYCSVSIESLTDDSSESNISSSDETNNSNSFNQSSDNNNNNNTNNSNRDLRLKTANHKGNIEIIERQKRQISSSPVEAIAQKVKTNESGGFVVRSLEACDAGGGGSTIVARLGDTCKLILNSKVCSKISTNQSLVKNKEKNNQLQEKKTIIEINKSGGYTAAGRPDLFAKIGKEKDKVTISSDIIGCSASDTRQKNVTQTTTVSPFELCELSKNKTIFACAIGSKENQGALPKPPSFEFNNENNNNNNNNNNNSISNIIQTKNSFANSTSPPLSPSSPPLAAPDSSNIVRSKSCPPNQNIKLSDSDSKSNSKSSEEGKKMWQKSQINK